MLKNKECLFREDSNLFLSVFKRVIIKFSHKMYAFLSKILNEIAKDWRYITLYWSNYQTHSNDSSIELTHWIY